ncbi:tubulin-specific chaperone E-like [Tachypleus tridentatus]|uniref:tubulin-specific chaperone E-like n=1 Tax=Tachypleus tridentatus TaxID=6853 RepID=UPI003FD0FCB2
MKEVFTVRPGSRVLCDGEFATVRYVGELPHILGNDIWYGVEWDNVCRGRHNGTHHGVKYFDTSHPTSGSFIRPQKADLGRTCLEAIVERYRKEENLLDVDVMRLPQKAGRDRVIELVGAEKVGQKQSHLDKLEEVVLRDMRVNGAGQPGELQTLIPSVTVLDLSRNLLSFWSEVARIAEQLPCLRELNVSENLIPVPEHSEDLQPSFRTLKTLVLNKMSYSWEQVLTCSKMWPQIERLELWKNEISLLFTPDSSTLQSLKYLSLEDNPLYSWQEVCKLGNLPRLEVLCLGNTTLSNIQFPGVKPNQKTDLFPALHCLMITHNRITQWKDIAELNKLVHLRELRISHNPVMTEFTPETCRQLVIAKLDCLQRLNREEVRRKKILGLVDLERKSLYRYNVVTMEASCLCLCDLSTSKGNFYQDSGRSHEQNGMVPHRFETVEICTPNDPSFSPVIKKLPSTMTVGKVKALVKRMYNVGVHEMSLGCVSSQAANMEIELDNDLRQLSFYSVGNGDRLCVYW